MNEILKVEDILLPKIFVHDFEFVDETLISDLDPRKYQNIRKVSIFYVSTITFAKSATSTHCSKLFDVVVVASFLQKLVERRLVTCSERVKQVYQKLFTS